MNSTAPTLNEETPIDVVLPADTIYFDYSGCKTLRSIALPDGMSDIEWCQFDNCTALEEVLIPEGVEVIGHATFYNCVKLRRVNIPQSVKKIYDSAFEGTPTELRRDIYATIEERGIELVDWDYEHDNEYIKNKKR